MVLDLRHKICGECQHIRPRGDEEKTAICGAVEPRGEVYGTAEKDGILIPLLTTVRPEVLETDPCCFRFADSAELDLLARFAQPERSPICAAPGCKCKRDGESEFCVDHEPEDFEVRAMDRVYTRLEGKDEA